MGNDWFEYRITEWFTDECIETEWVTTGLNTEKRNGLKMNAESRNG